MFEKLLRNCGEFAHWNERRAQQVEKAFEGVGKGRGALEAAAKLFIINIISVRQLLPMLRLALPVRGRGQGRGKWA